MLKKKTKGTYEFLISAFASLLAERTELVSCKRAKLLSASSVDTVGSAEDRSAFTEPTRTDRNYSEQYECCDNTKKQLDMHTKYLHSNFSLTII